MHQCPCIAAAPVRGASPIHQAIIDGCSVTGVTTMLLDEGWDTGDILLQKQVTIEPEDTAGSRK